MQKFVSFVLLSLCTSAAFGDTVKIQNVRPSRLLAILADANNVNLPSLLVQDTVGGVHLIPKGLRVRADDVQSVLIAEGDRSAIDAFVKTVSLFDVKPRDIGFEVNIESPLDKFATRVSGSSPSNNPWALEQARLDLNLNVRTRLNDDQTITLYVHVKHHGVENMFAARLNPGQNVEMYLEKPANDTTFLFPEKNNVRLILGKKSPSAIAVSLKVTLPETKSLPVR